ncbi:metallophosphoesterase [Patescibacteria group bacterium]|nr:metallophosphoesterase [Patescibacteria group bacterium]
MSDSHDNWENLEKAVELANSNGCSFLMFAGDLIAPSGIPILEKFNSKGKFVWGNNEGERMGITRKLDASPKIDLCGDLFEGEIDGIKIFMCHSPRIAELAAKSGEFDLCIYGHTHKYKEQKIGNCILVNPGAIQDYKTGKPCFAVFDTDTSKINRISL